VSAIVERIVTTNTVIAANSVTQVQAKCTSGVAINGGVVIAGGLQGTRNVSGQQGGTDGDTWFTYVENPNGFDVQGIPFALCVDAPYARDIGPAS